MATTVSRAGLLALASLLAACAETPDCDADITLATLNAKIRTVIEASLGARLRLPALAPGAVELNPRKLAEAARTDPVKILVENAQRLDSKLANPRQCRALVSLTLALTDSEQPIKKSGPIDFSIRKYEPGFLLEIQANEIAAILE